MTINIDAIMATKDGRTNAEVFAYPVEDSDDEGVKNQRHAIEIVGELTGGDSVINQGTPPGAGIDQDGTERTGVMFRITLEVVNTHRRTSSYRLDYHRFDGCPSSLSSGAMEVYSIIKRNLRRARLEVK